MLPNKELPELPPPNILPPDPDDPPKTFFEAASDEGLLPRPLKNPPLPPNILPPPLVVFAFISALPPNTEDEVVVVVAFSEPLKELPPKIDVDEVGALVAVAVLGVLLKELAPKIELEAATVVLVGEDNELA